MGNMGRYCKAYPVSSLRQFPAWAENVHNLRKEKQPEGKEAERRLSDDDFLYLQENLLVTDGIFIDQNIIFDQVTPEWKDFCLHTLNFEVPAHELKEEQGEEPQEALKSDATRDADGAHSDG